MYKPLTHCTAIFENLVGTSLGCDYYGVCM